MTRTVWWIRRDLRLTDNQALHAALARGGELLPLFVLDPVLLNSPTSGKRRTAFLLNGLAALDKTLAAAGSYLIVRQGDPAEEIARLCSETGATAVFAEADCSPYARRRDARVARSLGAVPLTLCDGITMRPLEAVRKEDGSPYTVYTPFSKRWLALPEIRRSDLLPAPTTILTPAGIAGMRPTPDEDAAALVPPGEAAGLAVLAGFAEREQAPIYAYANERDRPDLESTSRLSPYLRFGMLSPRRAAVAAFEAAAAAPTSDARRGAAIWLNELIWREFYQMILAEFPHVRRSSFRPAYDAIEWANDRADFAAWCEGRTGYPFVDAGMRQLLATGWMHNRSRMVVASFLVKDLLIDWRWGERWFMEQLVDGDPAANNGGWQWTAGTGTDAAPYFRIFNPVTQGEKFDPDGRFVRRWVPELAKLPDSFVHKPWTMSQAEQSRFGCRIGREYPAPIVDHQWARERTLAAFQAVSA